MGNAQEAQQEADQQQQVLQQASQQAPTPQQLPVPLSAHALALIAVTAPPPAQGTPQQPYTPSAHLGSPSSSQGQQSVSDASHGADSGGGAAAAGVLGQAPSLEVQKTRAMIAGETEEAMAPLVSQQSDAALEQWLAKLQGTLIEETRQHKAAQQELKQVGFLNKTSVLARVLSPKLVLILGSTMTCRAGAAHEALHMRAHGCSCSPR